jgi:hypothetical protein
MNRDSPAAPTGPSPPSSAPRSNCRPINKSSPGRRRRYVRNRALRILPVYSLVLLVTGWAFAPAWSLSVEVVFCLGATHPPVSGGVERAQVRERPGPDVGRPSCLQWHCFSAGCRQGDSSLGHRTRDGTKSELRRRLELGTPSS